MGSFDSGFRMGQGAYQQSIDNDRQKVLDGYKADEMARLKIDQGRQDAQRADEDAAYANVQTLRSGVSPEQQGLIGQTYGMTPQQTARAGPGLRAKLASYDAPDSYDMQQAPAEGSAPAFSAQGLKLTRASDGDLERASEGMYLARRDMAGVAQSKERQRGYDMRDITDRAAKMPLAELETQAKQLNNNGSEYPFLYLRQGKGGYTFMSKESDGTPGKEFTMNEAQLRQMSAAHALGEAGFGAESMAALSAAHKDVFEHVNKLNDTTVKMAAANTAATRYGNSDIIDAARVGVAQGGLAVQQGELGLRTRTQDRADNKFTTMIADVESATGTTLSPDQKNALVGLGKEETAHTKALVQGYIEQAKLGTITKDQFKASVDEVFAAPKRSFNESKIVEKLQKVHKAGGSAASQSAVSDMLKGGYTETQVRDFARRAGVTLVAPAGAAAGKDTDLPPRKDTGLRTPPRQITTLVPPRSAAAMRPAAAVAEQTTPEDFVKYFGGLPGKQ